MNETPVIPEPAPAAVVDRVVDRTFQWFPSLLMAMAMAMLVRLAARPLDDPDTWWHLRLGDDLWRQGTLGAPEGWSPRATVDWVPTEPVPEILAARLESWWGLPSLAWLFGLSTIVVLLTVYWACRREAAALMASVATLAAAIAMLGSLTPRPQLVSFVLLALVPVAWARVGESLRPPWWLVPLTWVWSMCHGFWLLGVGLSGLCWLGLVLDRRPSRVDVLRLAIVPAASVVVVLLNPAGWDVVLAPLSVNDTAQYISEWQRTSWSSARGVFFAAVLLLLAVLMARQRREVRWTEWLLLAAASFFCWYSIRTIAVAAVIAAPILARHLSTLVPERSYALARRREALVLGAGALVSVAVLAVLVPTTSSEPGGVPLGLSAELDLLPDGTPVLNAYGWGGWLAWRHPGLDRTSDGLVVPYDPDYIGDLSRVERAEGDWEALVPGLEVDYALLEDDTDVSTTLQSDGWLLVRRAEGAVLLSRPGVTFPAR